MVMLEELKVSFISTPQPSLHPEAVKEVTFELVSFTGTVLFTALDCNTACCKSRQEMPGGKARNQLLKGSVPMIKGF